MIDGRGRWQRWQTKRTTEDMLAIPIAFIRRRWGLSRTWSASMQWHRGAQVIGEIGLAIYPGRGVQLDYKWNGAPITTFVEFDYTEQPSGGRRTWWRCPGCGRRCGILYGGKLFLLPSVSPLAL